jgi:hypothetical protein
MSHSRSGVFYACFGGSTFVEGVESGCGALEVSGESIFSKA